VQAPLPSIPGYTVLRELARGGMGAVYLGRDERLGRMVAIKVLTPSGAAVAKQLERFRIEAETTARLRHPNLVAVHGVGRTTSGVYAVLDLIEGGSVQDRLDREGGYAPRQAVELLLGAAQGVAHAHAAGVLHRDLKPANLLLTKEGVVKVTDFGLAKDLHSTSGGLTKTGEVLGTPAFMPPEQIDQAEPDARADVYGLGATLYALLTGVPPFHGAVALNVLGAVMTQPPPPPSELSPQVPPDLEAICLRCLEKEPGQRYPSVEALIADLEAFLGGGRVAAGGRPGGGRVALAALALLAAAGAGAWWATRGGSQAPAELVEEPSSAGGLEEISAADRAQALALLDQALEGGEPLTIRSALAELARVYDQRPLEPDQVAALAGVFTRALEAAAGWDEPAQAAQDLARLEALCVPTELQARALHQARFALWSRAFLGADQDVAARWGAVRETLEQASQAALAGGAPLQPWVADARHLARVYEEGDPGALEARYLEVRDAPGLELTRGVLGREHVVSLVFAGRVERVEALWPFFPADTAELDQFDVERVALQEAAMVTVHARLVRGLWREAGRPPGRRDPRAAPQDQSVYSDLHDLLRELHKAHGVHADTGVFASDRADPWVTFLFALSGDLLMGDLLKSDHDSRRRLEHIEWRQADLIDWAEPRTGARDVSHALADGDELRAAALTLFLDAVLVRREFLLREQVARLAGHPPLDGWDEVERQLISAQRRMEFLQGFPPDPRVHLLTCLLRALGGR
jgi:Protein kinase domain